MHARAAHGLTNLRYVRPNMLSSLNFGFLYLPSPLPSLIALLPMSAFGQSITTASGLTAEETPVRPTTLSRTEHTRSMKAYFAPSTMSNTIASATSTSTTTTEDPNESAFKYYWLILAMFGVAVSLCLWWINRRRIKRKERMRLSGRNALARDMEGWANTRRWYHSSWTPNENRAFIRREEGLNEHGEAPPPYRPKGGVAVTTDPAARLSMPLRTLSRRQVDVRSPPGYNETLSRDSEHAARPAAAAPFANQPATAGSQHRSSVTGLTQHHNDRGIAA